MLASLNKIAKEIARKYKRKNWWADEEELRQIACLSALECAKTFDASKGSQEAYCVEVMTNDVSDYIMSASSPVSICKSYRKQLIGTVRAQLSDPAMDDYQVRKTPLDLFLEKELMHIVRSEITECLLKAKKDLVAPLLKILLEEASPMETAEECGLPVKSLYKAVHNIKRKLKTKKGLQGLCNT